MGFISRAFLRNESVAPAASGKSVLGAICGYIIALDKLGRMNVITYLLVPSPYSFNSDHRASP
jgi:hypothetical protein